MVNRLCLYLADSYADTVRVANRKRRPFPRSFPPLEATIARRVVQENWAIRAVRWRETRSPIASPSSLARADPPLRTRTPPKVEINMRSLIAHRGCAAASTAGLLLHGDAIRAIAAIRREPYP